MRKRLLTLLLATSMMVMSLTGCASLVQGYMNYTQKAEEAKESAAAQEASIQAKIESAEQAAASEAAAAAGAQAAESSQAATEGTEQTTAESTGQTVTESTEQITTGQTVTENTQQANADNIDWSTAYEGYFDREDILGKNIKATTTATAEDVTMSVIIAVTEETQLMSFDMGSTAMDMYMTGDKVYCCTKMMGQETWTYAIPESEEEVESVTSMQEDPTIDSEDVNEYSYRGEVVENGVVYDTLDVVVNNEDGTTDEMVAYVNRETQKLTKYEMEQDGTLATCYFEEIDSIEIPAAASNAKEVTMNEIVMTLLGVMLMGAGAAQ